MPQRRGLATPPPGVSMRARILRLVRSNPRLTRTQVAEAAGCSPSTVTRHLRDSTNPSACAAGPLLRSTAAAEAITGTALARRVPPTLPMVSSASILKRRDAAALAGPAAAVVLRRLSTDRYWDVRQAAARNRSCPPDLLAALAADGVPLVRFAAVANPNCPPGVFAAAATDPAPLPRSAAAARTLPRWRLLALARDRDYDVAFVARSRFGAS